MTLVTMAVAPYSANHLMSSSSLLVVVASARGTGGNQGDSSPGAFGRPLGEEHQDADPR